MINTEEKKIDCNKDQETYDAEHESDNLIKKNLIAFLEVQLKESKDKINKKEQSTEKEIISVYNRLNKDIEKSIKFSLEKLIIDFLPIFDNIERALNLIQTTKLEENYVEIINKLKCVHDILKETFIIFNIKKIDDINVPFNPSIHQAMSIHYTNEIESNQIVTVMQPGYMFHESRLLRPAMVIVSKKKT